MASVELFRRRWSVTIGPAGKEGRKWTGLRTKFKIEKTGDATPNKILIEVYNLSDDSRSYIKKGMSILLEAGYETETRLLCQADIVLATHPQDGPDIRTKIDAGDGHKAHHKVMHASFGHGTSEASIMRKIAKEMGVKLGKMTLSKQTTGHGIQLSGAASAQMSALCKSRGLRWSIQDGVLQIAPSGTDTGEEAVLLSASTGMIGSPEKTEKHGYKVKSLLQGGINPGRRIKIVSRDVNGVFIAEKVVHHGDTHGHDWYTELECNPQ